jgi:glycosyltransferase involved in cell wall biosynthesis
MKLVIQIPCHNEELTLPATVEDLPTQLDGISEIECLVVDDGSADQTVEVARALGVQHVHRLPHQRGLARAFSSGLTASLERGADIIVNTDGDNQYSGADIDKLIEPILRGEADMVIGERPISEIAHFSPVKKILQKLGSWVVRLVSGTEVPDATSGFRAFSRQTAMRLNVFSAYTYTLETLIQAGHSDIAVVSVPIRTNKKLRESRLISSIPSYIRRSVMTMIRMFLLYKPLRFFASLGSILFLGGFLVGARFIYYYVVGEGAGHIQSLILAAVLLLMGFQLIILGLVADLIAFNRRILEDLQYRDRRRTVTECEPNG